MQYDSKSNGDWESVFVSFLFSVSASTCGVYRVRLYESLCQLSPNSELPRPRRT